MMSVEQAQVVKMVYSRFISSEEEVWTDLDENLELVGFLKDSELVVEAEIKADIHCKGIRCRQNHEKKNCFAPYILESVEAIIALYHHTGQLPTKNRYILEFYIAMSELNMLYAG